MGVGPVYRKPPNRSAPAIGESDSEGTATRSGWPVQRSEAASERPQAPQRARVVYSRACEASTMARIPALTASGRSAQASTTRVRSGSLLARLSFCLSFCLSEP